MLKHWSASRYVYFDGATLLHSQSIESITFQRVSTERSTRCCLSTRLEYNNINAAAAKRNTKFLHFVVVSACEHTNKNVYFEHVSIAQWCSHDHTFTLISVCAISSKTVTHTDTWQQYEHILQFSLHSSHLMHIGIYSHGTPLWDTYACARTQSHTYSPIRTHKSISLNLLKSTGWFGAMHAKPN